MPEFVTSGGPSDREGSGARPGSDVGVVDRDALAEIARMLIAVGHVRATEPLVPRWVNLTIVELDEAGRLAERVLVGDPPALRRLPLLLAQERPGRGALTKPSDPNRDSMERRSGDPGARTRPMPPAVAMRWSGPSGPHRSCLIDDGRATNVGLGGLTIDVLTIDAQTADRLDDRTRPTTVTSLARAFLSERAGALDDYRDLLTEFVGRDIGMREFDALTRVEGPQGELEPLVYRDLDGSLTPTGAPSEGPTASWSSPLPTGRGGHGLARPLPALPQGPDGLRTRRCDSWQQCLDAFVGIAESYEPAPACPRDADIGTISPRAVCRGSRGVRFEIRPVPGSTFPTGGSCTPYLQNGPFHREALTVVSRSPDVITVELDEATTSGCVGFRGSASGGRGDLMTVITCLRLGRIHNPALVGLLTPTGQPVHISCQPNGANRVEVVPPPVLDRLHASGEGALIDQNRSSSGSITIVAEGCREVVLSWRFAFGGEEPTVDPADHVTVRITDGAGTVIAEGRDHAGTEPVTARDDVTYTLLAVAEVAGDTCGQATATVVVEREHRLHLVGLWMLRSGESGFMVVERSCPSPPGGTKVALTSSRPDRLEVPLSAVIPEGETSVMVEVRADGSGCAPVVITARAQGHIAKAHEVTVYDRPILESVHPASVSACGSFTLQLTGTCFSGPATSVRLRRGNVERTMRVLGASTTDIACDIDAADELALGVWDVVVISRGLESSPAALQITPVEPLIVRFWSSTLAPVWPCVAREVSLMWEVRDAHRVVVHQVGVPESVFDEPSPVRCGSVTGGVPHEAQGRRVYRLQAYPEGPGDPASADVFIPERQVPRARWATFWNESSSDEWVLWRYSSASGTWTSTTVPPGNNRRATFEACAYQYVFAVNRSEIGAAADSVGTALNASSAATLLLPQVMVPQPSLATPLKPDGAFHLLGDPTADPVELLVGAST